MNTSSNSLTGNLFYQKSLAIFNLSRRIATYITDDKEFIGLYRSGNKADNYADNLVLNALRLVPKIAEVEVEPSAEKKYKYAKSLRYFIDRIYQDCLRLEQVKIPGKDFVKMLRKELLHLRKLHKNYVNSLM
ncbi:MAG: hypothetical protein ACWA42_00660 [Lutibacter sp.]